ncbi:predicted protein [Histoplasma capsulatum var. duboisii H88]|uniref:Predicted protein n=1 Tax=Ajellomyces capsulatus (strain H88) TaxID=544711 RepID=F0UGF2_AJEC8|nr:predicted protein [Histoplasma capsulatum var. duboisii H88]
MNVQVQNRRQEVLDTCLRERVSCSRRLLSVRFPAILETTGVDEKAGRGELRITEISNEGHAMRFGYLPVETKAEAINDFSKGIPTMLLLGNGGGRYHSCVTLMRDDNHACPQSALTAYAVLSALKWGAKVNGKGLACDMGISAHMSSVGIRNNGKGSFDPFPLNLFELKCRSLQ